MTGDDTWARILTIPVVLICGGLPTYWLLRVATRQGPSAKVGCVVVPLLLGSVLGIGTALVIGLYVIGTYLR